MTVTTAAGTSITSPADDYQYTVHPTVTSLSPSTGPSSGGNVVTIKGKNLSFVRAVYFGRTAASIEPNFADTQIQVVVPKGSGTVAVTLISSCATPAKTNAGSYTY